MNDKVDDILGTCGHCGKGGFPIEHPAIAVDVDGTIFENGYYPDYGPPIKDVAYALNVLRDMGFKIHIWTSRLSVTDITGKLQNLNKVMHGLVGALEEHKIPYDYIFPAASKPSLFYKLVDDRALQFDKDKGGWEAILVAVSEDLAKKNIPIMADKSKYLKQLVL